MSRSLISRRFIIGSMKSLDSISKAIERELYVGRCRSIGSSGSVKTTLG